MPTFTGEDSGVGFDDAWLFVRSLGTDIDEDMAAPMLKYVDHVTFPHTLGAMLRRDPNLGSIRFTAAYPTDPAQCPVIVYTLVSRTPGINGVEPYKFRHRFTYMDVDGNRVDVFGQWMTCVYQFDCCANTAQEADAMVIQLDNFIRNTVWEFQQLGVKDILFQEQLTDVLLPKTDRIITRSIRWVAYLEFLDIRTLPAIRDVQLNAMLPRAEFVDTVTRGSSINEGDQLSQTYISKILFVSDPHLDGTARIWDYVPGVDFITVFDPYTTLTTIIWLEPGKRPEPGDTYYVRYLHWTAFSTLFLP